MVLRVVPFPVLSQTLTETSNALVTWACYTLCESLLSHTKAFSCTRVVMLAFIKKNLLLIMIHSAPSLI